jgi:hypothetical protein
MQDRPVRRPTTARPTPADATRSGWSRLLARLDALVFAAAGCCTCATVLVVVDRDVASVASVLGSMLTLAGLFMLSFGTADERPLRRVPAAQALLMTAAVAAVLQTVAIQLRSTATGDGRVSAVLVPGAGLLGGVAVAAAVVALAAARRRHAVRTVTLVGLSVIAVSAVTTNAVALLADHPLLTASGGTTATDALVHVSVVASGVGQLVIAVGFWRWPLRDAAG